MAKHPSPKLKATDGLGRVLYVRTNQKMVDALEAERVARGGDMSQADVARLLLWEALRNSGMVRSGGER